MPNTENAILSALERLINNRIAKDVVQNAREVLALAKRGVKIIFPDIFTIYAGLEAQLRENV